MEPKLGLLELTIGNNYTELPIHLLLPPECWDCRHAAPCMVYVGLGMRLRISFVYARQALYPLSESPAPQAELNAILWWECGRSECQKGCSKDCNHKVWEGNSKDFMGNWLRVRTFMLNCSKNSHSSAEPHYLRASFFSDTNLFFFFIFSLSDTDLKPKHALPNSLCMLSLHSLPTFFYQAASCWPLLQMAVFSLPPFLLPPPGTYQD